MDKIQLFTSPTCVRCPAVKEALKRLIEAKGQKFDEVVSLRDIKADPEAMTDLMMLNSFSTPTIKMGDTVLTGDISEDQLKDALEAMA
jgi:predicted DsbA family dithiol-disulfide isomerase